MLHLALQKIGYYSVTSKVLIIKGKNGAHSIKNRFFVNFSASSHIPTGSSFLA